MSEMVHVDDLCKGDVIVLSMGEVCTVLAVRGGEIHAAKGAGDSLGETAWLGKWMLTSAHTPGDKILVLYREQLVPVN
jgi:hypothetical protein